MSVKEFNIHQHQTAVAVLVTTKNQLECQDCELLRLLAGFPTVANVQEAASQHFEFIFCADEGRLALMSIADHGMKPLVVDFLGGKMGYRAAKVQQNREVICKAVGMKQDKFPFVLDATAGLGRDAFVLAAAGSKVVALERSPVVFLLLQDGLNRAQNSELSAISSRIQLFQADAVEWLSKIENNHSQRDRSSPEVIYLDPMFPERKKSAAVKKEMQIFQQLLGFDLEPETLFEKALTLARKRVVVKRPTKAPTVTARKPTMQYSGKSARFDVYVVG